VIRLRYGLINGYKTCSMKPFYLEVAESLQLTIIPDSDAHMDGHPVLTYSYSIYRFVENDDLQVKQARLHLEDKCDTDYLGVILFEAPGRSFTYHAGSQSLSGHQVEDLIEKITHYRDNPAMWLI
jgi:hypothetical protein